MFEPSEMLSCWLHSGIAKKTARPAMTCEDTTAPTTTMLPVRLLLLLSYILVRPGNQSYERLKMDALIQKHMQRASTCRGRAKTGAISLLG